MILKRNFDPRKVGVYVWPQLLAALLWSAAVYVAYEMLGWSFVSVPFGVLGILGTALALFLAFRNNTAFGRWGEASQAWAAITAASRTFARLVVTFTDSHAHTPQYNAVAAESFKRTMLYRHLAWVNALRMQLRGQMDVDALASYLDAAEVDALSEAHSKPGALLLIAGAAHLRRYGCRHAARLRQLSAGGTTGGAGESAGDLRTHQADAGAAPV